MSRRARLGARAPSSRQYGRYSIPKVVRVHKARVTPTGMKGVEVVEIASSETFPRHAHDDFGIGLILEGAHSSWSATGQVEAQCGEIIATNPAEIHDGKPVGGPRRWRMIFLAPSLVAEMLSRPESTLEIQFAVAADTALRDLLVDTFDALIGSDENHAEQSLALLLERTFSSTCASPEAASHTYSSDVQAVVDRIVDSPASPPRLVEVAELMKMTKTAALRRFTRETGITPHAYAQQLRVRLARKQICTGTPISDVALRLGFADQSHLTRAFKRQFGAPPGHWKARKSNIVQD